MKEVILAKSAGFCFGVQRAMDTVYAEADKKRAIEAAEREAALQNRALEAEMRAEQYLQDKGWLARELEAETQARKAREADIERLREAGYKLESELEEMKKSLASLQALNATLTIENKKLTTELKAAQQPETVVVPENRPVAEAGHSNSSKDQ